MKNTKFILHGGNTSIETSSNKEFFGEITKSFDKSVNLLCIYPHRDLNSLNNLFKKNINQFVQSNRNIRIEADFVYDNPKETLDKLQKSDVVYVPGGNTFMILDLFRMVPDFDKVLKGKIYMGSSGGAYAVCEYFFENSYPGVYRGLGLVPYKIIGHYGSVYAGSTKKDWEVRVVQLNQKGSKDIEVLKLKEAEYRVYQ